MSWSRALATRLDRLEAGGAPAVLTTLRERYRRGRRVRVVAASTMLVGVQMAAGVIAGAGLPSAQAVSACTLTSTTSGLYTIDSYESPVANDDCTASWALPSGVTSVDLLAVAGGGEAGVGVPSAGASAAPGGGGAGEVIEQTALAVSGALSITVGRGGSDAVAGMSTARQGQDGSDTAVTGGASVTARGGGGGGGSNGATGTAGRPGGSGGGGGELSAAGGASTAVSPGLGHAGGTSNPTGGPAASGGGAGGAGTAFIGSPSPIAAGAGVTSTIPATPLLVGEGGGVYLAGGPTAQTIVGGGGNGATYSRSPTLADIAGHNGIVVIRYLTPPPAPPAPPAPSGGGGGGSVVSYGPPSDPQAATATVSGGSAVVTWQPPLSDGGLPITQYVVVAYSTGAPIYCVALPPATSCTLTGLDPTVVYTITVAAYNADYASNEATATQSSPTPAPTAPVLGPQPVPGPPTAPHVSTGMTIHPDRTKEPTGYVGQIGTLEVTMRSVESNKPVPLSAGALVVHAVRGKVAVSGSGFVVGSPVQVWILPGTLLGTLTVDPNGRVTGLLAIPATVAPGRYQIQANGIDELAQVRSMTVPALIQGSVRTQVFFAPLSATVSADGRERLRALVQRTGKRAGAVVSLGFVQPVGPTTNDGSLSLARAQAVADRLRALGLTGTYTVRGLGRAPQSGASARRVEVSVTYPG